MAILYMDPVNGNDANDGTTFANRFKTFGSGATAARIAPGDTIRIIANPDPVNTGSASWTDNSKTVTFAANKGKVIDNATTGWVASANITITYSAAAQSKLASNMNITPASGFTTGKMAYKTLGATLDLSAFEQLSCWLYATTSAVSMRIALCSDSTGDVVVESFDYNTTNVSNTYRSMVFNKAAAMGSTINSIAIYALSDPGTGAQRFANFVACKASGHADEVTHNTLFGKNTSGEPEWYNVHEIGDNFVTTSGNYQTTAASTIINRPYRGTSESVDTYLIQPVDVSALSTAARTATEAGTSASPITYSGGWNRTDMSTQTGETWLTGSHFVNAAVLLNGLAYINMDNIGVTNCIGGGINNIGNGSIITCPGSIGCFTFFDTNATTDMQSFDLQCDQVWGMGDGAISNVDGTNWRVRIGRMHGCPVGSSSLGVLQIDAFHSDSHRLEVGKLDNNGCYGIYISGAGSDMVLHNTTFENNSVGNILVAAAGTRVSLNNCSDASGTIQAGSRGSIRETNIGGVNTAHKTTVSTHTLQSETTTVHSSGISWKLTITNTTPTVNFPIQEEIARVAVNAGSLVTVKAWLRRTNTGLALGIGVRGEWLGLGSDSITYMSAAADTWEEVTLTFTPDFAGVIPIYLTGYTSNVSYNGFLDDMTITQA